MCPPHALLEAVLPPAVAAIADPAARRAALAEVERHRHEEHTAAREALEAAQIEETEEFFANLAKRKRVEQEKMQRAVAASGKKSASTAAKGDARVARREASSA